MKICFVLEHFIPHVGGVEILFAELVRGLVESGHEVRVVTSTSGGVTGVSGLSGAVVYHTETVSFFGHPLIPPAAIRPHAEWADVVNTTTYTAALPAWIVARQLKKPIVLSVMEVIGQRWNAVESNPLLALAFRAFERLVVTRSFTAWHVISKATLNDLSSVGVDPRNIRVIYPGIDYKIWNENVESTNLTKYFNIKSQSRVFLYTGRPGKSKGLHVLLEAIKIVNPSLDPSFVFGLILSKDPSAERAKINAYIKQHSLGDRVFVIDSIPYRELPAVRKASFAVVVPSLTEGFGFVAAETAALGVPIVSSDAGSLPEVLGGSVIMFESSNSADLANALVLASQDNFQHIEGTTFTWSDSVEKLENLYKEL